MPIRRQFEIPTQSTFQVSRISKPLWSVGKLCDAGYKVEFGKAAAVVAHESSGKKIEEFKEAQGGSMGMDLTDKVLYTAKGARAIKSLRKEVFNKSLSPDIISDGKTIGNGEIGDIWLAVQTLFCEHRFDYWWVDQPSQE